MGSHSFDLEGIFEVMEINKEEQHVSEDELGRRLRQAEDVCRELKERHAHLYEHGLIIEELINEMEAEKKSLTCKLKKSQQEVEDIRKKWREDAAKEDEEEEGAKERLSLEERIRSQLISKKMMEKNIQELREKNEALKTKLHKLSQQARRGKEIYNLKKTEQEFKKKVDDIHEVLCRRDEEIDKLNTTLSEKNNELEEYYNTIKDLRQDQRELREQLSSRQEKQIIALTSETTRKQPAAETMDEVHKVENSQKTNRWWGVAKCLWRGVIVAGAISQCVLLTVGIMAAMVPVCNCPNPDCDLLNVGYELLDTFIQHTHIATF